MNMNNQAKKDQLMKQYSLYELEKAYFIQLPSPYVYNMWQPWLKNYHGEIGLGYGMEGNWVKYTWLDQELKKQMTGR